MKKGICKNAEEEQKQVSSKLAEIELDRNIALGREDYKNGRYEEVNEENTKKFLHELEKELPASLFLVLNVKIFTIAHTKIIIFFMI